LVAAQADVVARSLIVLWISLVLLPGYPAAAAQIEVRSAPEYGNFITVDGVLRSDDGDRFTSLFLNSGASRVLFNSDGGSLMAAIEIGRAIRLRGNVATYVAPTGVCASACALAWLAGSEKYMANNRQVGFHAAFIKENDRKIISANGNAVVGAYLNQIGLSIPAIFYLLKESPDDMLWLTFSVADALQIDVKRGSAVSILLGDPKRFQEPHGRHDEEKVAQPPSPLSRGILYEEGETAGARGAALRGDVKWEMVRESIGGAPPEPIVRVTVAVPERQATARIIFRRNRDRDLPASHLVEVAFELPPDFPGGDISNLPGIILKVAEDARGDALIGASARVDDDLFWIALSASGADIAHNLELLERGWIDVPFVYGNGRRAILTIEKGVAGREAILQVVNAWATESAN
jgi:hypothetical protein